MNTRTCLVSLAMSAIASAAEPYENWGPPYRLIYGGYSMVKDDWELWDGVFNLVHHSVVGRERAEARRILNAAKSHKMKILSPISVWDKKAEKIDVSKLQQTLDNIGRDEPALFGYVFEAAYTIPPDRQKLIYDAIKKTDPTRPVWMEYSSTSGVTWKRFNPEACDAVMSYNYPYEAKDKGPNAVVRVSYSVQAMQAVKPKSLPVIPLLQAFGGSRWRVVPRGGMADQFDRWLEIEPVAGVSFYRWRKSGNYAGLFTDGSESNYTWEEVKQLCRQLAEQHGPAVDAAAWRKAAGRSKAAPGK